MLIKKDERKTVTYYVGDDYYIDVVICKDSNPELLEVWLYREDMGVKMYMFGVLTEDILSGDSLVDIIKRNNVERLKRIYEQEVNYKGVQNV